MIIQNFDKEFDRITESFCGEKKTLFLHACCASCSSSVLERVTPFFDTTVFFYNPNITDEGEYEKRFGELKRFVATVYGDTVKVVGGEYEPQKFYDLAKGRENLTEGGARCFDCYSLRLDETARLAKEGNFDYFCTTLSVSPYKNATVLNQKGGESGERYGVEYLYSDFKKKQGYVRSIELSKEYGLYRQNYCGCKYSQKIEQKD